MSNHKLTLLEHAGKLYVERLTTDWCTPLAVRMWWLVDYAVQSPSVVRADPPVGQALTSLPAGNVSGDYEHVATRYTFFLPLRGRTPASHIWHAAIPQAGRDDTWRGGTWVRQYRTRKPRELSVAWDKLTWTVIK